MSVLIAVVFQIVLHVAPETVSETWLDQMLAVANAQFAAVDASFAYASRDEHSAAHVVTRTDRDAFAKQVTDNQIHVFVIGKLENVDDDKPVHGVTWRGKGKRYIIIAADSPDRVLAHELGHLFGLPHSTYKISIMNKTKRDDPPLDQRRFSDEELKLLRANVKSSKLAQHAP
ncbi:MAG TPA: matrixin family metalloprotease [Kofleriaceae bacterium]